MGTVTRTWLRDLVRSRRTWLCVALLVGVALVTWDVLSYGPLTRLDWWTHLYVATNVHGGWWWLCDLPTFLGNQWVLLTPLGVLSLCTAARYRSLRPLAVPAGVCIWLLIFVPLFKDAISRSWPRSGVDLMFYPGGSEFPSGHAINAIVIWGMFLELLAATSHADRWLSERARRWLTAAVTGIAGLGMVGVDYHWLSDVFAGWLLGAAIYVVFLALDFFRPLREVRTGLRPVNTSFVPGWVTTLLRERRTGTAPHTATGAEPIESPVVAYRRQPEPTDVRTVTSSDGMNDSNHVGRLT